MNSQVKPQSVAIIYGFAEGPVHGRALRSGLISAGFSITNTPYQADIVITHSGGTIFLPHQLAAQIIIMIAPSCGRDRKSFLRPAWAKISNDLPYFLKTNQEKVWLHKLFWNMFYLITNLNRSIMMAVATIRGLDKLPSLKATSIVVITYDGDPWSGYIPEPEITRHPNYHFIKRTGIHDDIWLNPDPYIALINDVLAR